LTELLDQKEYYETWCIYLQENKKYKEYCDFFAESKKLAKKRIGANATEEEIFDEAYERVYDKYRMKFLRTYIIFGDVSKSFDFENWWKYRFSEIYELQKDKFQGITLSDSLLPKCADKLVTNVCGKCKGDATKKDIILRQLREFFRERHGSVFVKINTMYPKNQLMEEIESIVEAHKKRYGINRKKGLRYLNRITPLPDAARLPEDAMNYPMYLKAYKLKQQGKDWVALAEEMGIPAYMPCDNKITDSTYHVLWRYVDCATNIMKNLEKCEFPGNY
jgi:hypothetical protein